MMSGATMSSDREQEFWCLLSHYETEDFLSLVELHRDLEVTILYQGGRRSAEHIAVRNWCSAKVREPRYETMQTVFRIRPGRPKARIANLDDGQAAKIRRRSHKKSRLGCQNCKVRRVKCDESRESGCGNCRQHGIDCDYLSTTNPLPVIRSSTDGSTGKTPSSALTPTTAKTPESLLAVEDNNAITRQNSPPAKLYPSLRFMSSLVYQSPEDLAPVLQVMSYFELVTCSTITSTSGVSVFKDALLSLSHHCDYLMHAMLGISAAHLCQLDSIAQDSTQVARFRKTENYHWSHALRGYRTALAQDAKSDTADSLITVCMLIGIHSFYMANPNEISFVDAAPSQRRARLQWLQVVHGFVPVMRHIGAFLGSCAWAGVFNEASPWEKFVLNSKDFCFNGEDEMETCLNFLALCDIDLTDDQKPNIYKSALKDLFVLFQIGNVSMRDFAFLMAFQGRLGGEFLGFLLARDKKALLIMLHWLVQLEKLQLWWTKSRAECEANAILRFLDDDLDPLIQALLERPRAAFGFVSAA